jgi:hypothetical protein
VTEKRDARNQMNFISCPSDNKCGFGTQYSAE